MPKVRNVYVPRWVPWFMLVIVGLTWVWTTYRVFWEGGSEDLGIGGWAVMSLMMLAVVVLVFLLGYRKLPAYQIEEDEDA
jgi:amino acid transporter